jgi:hypothetical protein
MKLMNDVVVLLILVSLAKNLSFFYYKVQHEF